MDEDNDGKVSEVRYWDLGCALNDVPPFPSITSEHECPNPLPASPASSPLALDLIRSTRHPTPPLVQLEFTKFMLLAMGKLDKEMLDQIDEEFKKLDADG